MLLARGGRKRGRKNSPPVDRARPHDDGGISTSQEMTKTGNIVIGNKESDFVVLEITGLEPGGEWASANIEVHRDGWTGTMKGSFMKGELARFATAIRRLHRDLTGVAQLDPTEPNIVLTLTGDGKGHVTVDGVARNNLTSGSRLTFRFTIDQTYLEGIADSLNDADEV
jgi:hypothetical protein